MIIEIRVKESDARIWEYFLQKRYKTKAKLKRLCKVASSVTSSLTQLEFTGKRILVNRKLTQT